MVKMSFQGLIRFLFNTSTNVKVFLYIKTDCYLLHKKTCILFQLGHLKKDNLVKHHSFIYSLMGTSFNASVKHKLINHFDRQDKVYVLLGW